VAPQETVLTEELPQDAPRNVCGGHIGLQKLYPRVFCILRKGFFIIPGYQQKKTERLLKLQEAVQ
jgi:hypothetical protein